MSPLPSCAPGAQFIRSADIAFEAHGRKILPEGGFGNARLSLGFTRMRGVGMATCLECGTQLTEGAKFCSECGVRVEVKAADGVPVALNARIDPWISGWPSAQHEQRMHARSQ